MYGDVIYVLMYAFLRVELSPACLQRQRDRLNLESHLEEFEIWVVDPRP